MKTIDERETTKKQKQKKKQKKNKVKNKKTKTEKNKRGQKTVKGWELNDFAAHWS